jgi:hypothetical protein
MTKSRVKNVLQVLSALVLGGVSALPAQQSTGRDAAQRREVDAVRKQPRVADAAMRRDMAAVRALVQQGADVNVAQGDGMTALHWAARNGDAAMTTLLIGAKANLKASTRIGGYTPWLRRCSRLALTPRRSPALA